MLPQCEMFYLGNFNMQMITSIDIRFCGLFIHFNVKLMLNLFC